MRETLHQLTLALALPIAVGAVWIVRGESVANPVPETATAYRAELEDLPLPTRERLRTPDVATDWRAPRVTPEDPTSRRRSPLLPNQSAPPPVDLAVGASSETAVAAPPSPRAEPDLPGAPLPAPIGAPALVAAAPAAASHPRATVPKIVASTVPVKVPDTVSAVPAQSATASSAAKTAAQTSTGSSVAKAVVQSITGTSSAQPPAQSFTGSSGTRAPVQTSPGKSVVNEIAPAVLQSVSIPDRPTRDADPVEIPKNLPEQFPNPIGHAPLMPPGGPEDPPIGLWLQPDSPEPSLPPIDLPLPALEHAAVASSVDYGADELPSSAQALRWFATPTTLLLIPEPGSAILLGAALAALGAARRIRRRA